MPKSTRSIKSLSPNSYASRKFIITLIGLLLIAILGLCGVSDSGALAGSIAVLASAYIAGNSLTKGA
jgi:L-cystine uptake protein TcyP (sodium:dicarboxylate symporter family)